MKRTRILGGLAVLAILGATIALIPKRQRTTSMLPQAQTEGLPEQGLVLVGPKEASFNKLLAAVASDARTRAARTTAVFVVNKAPKSVAACLVKWDALYSDGRTITYTRAHENLLRTVSDGSSSHLPDDILPNGNKLFSLTDPDDSSSVHVSMGGGGGPDVASQLLGSVTIKASIDGVLFVDGTFVGPDTANYFAILRAEVEARRDMLEEIGQSISSGAGPKAALDHLDRIEGPANHSHATQPGSDKDAAYWIMKKRCAAPFQAMRKARGDQAVIDLVRAELSKPRIDLRKL